MNLTEIKGLRFPDEYVIKFFFKTDLHKRVGDALELGCGNGNNLMLFYQFGWNVVGVDISGEALSHAKSNFEMVNRRGSGYEFISHDLAKGVPDLGLRKFDVILLPNILCYLEGVATAAVMRELGYLTKAGSYIFVRTRSLKDYRYGRGDKVGRNAFRLNTPETGEQGLLNVFYHEYELVDMLRNHFHIDVPTMELLWLDCPNPQNGAHVLNSDIVIWGRTCG